MINVGNSFIDVAKQVIHEGSAYMMSDEAPLGLLIRHGTSIPMRIERGIITEKNLVKRQAYATILFVDSNFGYDIIGKVAFCYLVYTVASLALKGTKKLGAKGIDVLMGTDFSSKISLFESFKNSFSACVATGLIAHNSFTGTLSTHFYYYANRQFEIFKLLEGSDLEEIKVHIE